MDNDDDVRPPDAVYVESLLSSPNLNMEEKQDEAVVWFEEEDHQIMEAIRSSLEDEIRRVETLRQKYAMIHSRLRMIASTSRDRCAIALCRLLDQAYGDCDLKKDDHDPGRDVLVKWISESGPLFLPLLELSYFGSET